MSSNTDKKASMWATAKIWGARASEHSFKFCSKSSKGKILRAVKNFHGPFITPIYFSFRNSFKRACLFTTLFSVV